MIGIPDFRNYRVKRHLVVYIFISGFPSLVDWHGDCKDRYRWKVFLFFFLPVLKGICGTWRTSLCLKCGFSVEVVSVGSRKIKRPSCDFLSLRSRKRNGIRSVWSGSMVRVYWEFVSND